MLLTSILRYDGFYHNNVCTCPLSLSLTLHAQRQRFLCDICILLADFLNHFISHAMPSSSTGSFDVSSIETKYIGLSLQHRFLINLFMSPHSSISYILVQVLLRRFSFHVCEASSNSEIISGNMYKITD